MKQSSFLRAWLEGRTQPDLRILNNCVPNLEDDIWVALNYEMPFHLVNSEKILGLNEAWEKNKEYFEEAIKIALDYNGYDLDHEDRYDIIEKLGEPPDVSHPIYLITIKNSKYEQLVYVGKSSSNSSRFVGGHSIALKLLDPKYNEFEKIIYFAQIMTYHKEYEYLPLEFISNKTLAEEILDDVESMMINYLKPTLNEKKTKTFSTKHSFRIFLENHIPSSFLNDCKVF